MIKLLKYSVPLHAQNKAPIWLILKTLQLLPTLIMVKLLWLIKLCTTASCFVKTKTLEI